MMSYCNKVVADSDGSKFVDSKKHSSFVGRHTSTQVMLKGELQACHEFCPWPPALPAFWGSTAAVC